MPSQILIAAFTAQGRPAFGLYAPLIGVAVLCAGLLLGADGDVVTVGLARFAADLAQVLAVFTFGAIAIGLAPQHLLGILAAPWIAALTMAVAVAAIAYVTPDHWPPLATPGASRCERSGNLWQPALSHRARPLGEPVARLSDRTQQSLFPGRLRYE